MNNIQAIGGVVYINYAYLFIMASFILLVALVGVMVVTYRRKN